MPGTKKIIRLGQICSDLGQSSWSVTDKGEPSTGKSPPFSKMPKLGLRPGLEIRTVQEATPRRLLRREHWNLLVWETSVSMSKLSLTIHRILRTTTLHSWWLTSKCPICTRGGLCWPEASSRSRLNMLCHSECFPTTLYISRDFQKTLFFVLLAQLCRHRDKKVLSSHC